MEHRYKALFFVEEEIYAHFPFKQSRGSIKKAGSSVRMNPKPISYFLYNRPYRVSECSNKKVLNALKILQSETNSPIEEEEGYDQGQAIIRALRFLRAIKR